MPLVPLLPQTSLAGGPMSTSLGLSTSAAARALIFVFWHPDSAALSIGLASTTTARFSMRYPGKSTG